MKRLPAICAAVPTRIIYGLFAVSAVTALIFVGAFIALRAPLYRGSDFVQLWNIRDQRHDILTAWSGLESPQFLQAVSTYAAQPRHDLGTTITPDRIKRDMSISIWQLPNYLRIDTTDTDSDVAVYLAKYIGQVAQDQPGLVTPGMPITYTAAPWTYYYKDSKGKQIIDTATGQPKTQPMIAMVDTGTPGIQSALTILLWLGCAWLAVASAIRRRQGAPEAVALPSWRYGLIVAILLGIGAAALAVTVPNGIIIGTCIALTIPLAILRPVIGLVVPLLAALLGGLSFLNINVPIGTHTASSVDLFLAVPIIGLLGNAFLIKRFKRPNTPLDIPILLFMVVGVVAAGVGILQHHTTHDVFLDLRLYLDAAMFFVAVLCIRDRDDLGLLAWVGGTACVIAALVGAYLLLLRQGAQINIGYAIPVLRTVSISAGTAVAAGFFILVSLVASRYAKVRGLAGLAVAGLTLSSALLIVLTEGRGLWLGMFAAMAILLAITPGRFQRLRLGLAMTAPIMLAVFMVMGLQVLSNTSLIPYVQHAYGGKRVFPSETPTSTTGSVFDRPITISTTDPTEMWRTSLWKAALDAIKQNPVIGQGLGYDYTFYDNVAKQNISYPDAHNGFLDAWAKAGLLGLFAYSLFNLLFLWTGWQAIRRAPGHDAVVMRALLVGYVLIVGTNMYQPNWETPAIGLFGWVFLGLFYAIAQLQPAPSMLPETARAAAPGGLSVAASQ